MNEPSRETLLWFCLIVTGIDLLLIVCFAVVLAVQWRETTDRIRVLEEDAAVRARADKDRARQEAALREALVAKKII